MRAGDWSPVQWFNPKFVEVADEINSMRNLIAAGEICAWNFRQRGLSIFFDKEVADGGNAFCTINEKTMQTISATPETKATPRTEYQAQADNLWRKASQVLIACRFSTTSSRLLAVFCSRPAFGDAFVPMDVHDENHAKAFAAFLNSSFSIIQMLNRRTKKLTYPKYEKGHMKTLMLPDPSTADLAPLLEAFEAVKDIPLQRLSMCAQDAARKTLDHAAARALGIAPATTDQWREWLSKEPTITGKPATP